MPYPIRRREQTFYATNSETNCLPGLVQKQQESDFLYLVVSEGFEPPFSVSKTVALSFGRRDRITIYKLTAGTAGTESLTRTSLPPYRWPDNRARSIADVTALCQGIYWTTLATLVRPVRFELTSS